MSKRLRLFVLGCIAAWGCRGLDSDPGLRLVEDPAIMTHQLAEMVPQGTPVEMARETLEQNGFDTQYEEFEGVTYLTGIQRRTGHTNLGLRSFWSVTVYHQDGLVQDLQARYDTVAVEHGLPARGPATDRGPAGAHRARRHRPTHDHAEVAPGGSTSVGGFGEWLAPGGTAVEGPVYGL